MAGISAPGVGSGLDVNSIVTQLMDLERRPLLNLQSRERDVESQISAYGKLNSALSTFQDSMKGLSDLAKFQAFTPTSGDEDVFTASANENAKNGSFNLNVTALAAKHKLASGAFADSSAVVGTGTLSISAGDKSLDISIDASNNSLEGIRDAINNASGNDAVTATLLRDDAGTRLLLTSNETGTSNAIEVTVSGDGDGSDSDNAGLSQLVFQSGGVQNLLEQRLAKDAVVEIDGFAVTSASNQVSGAIDGVTLDLKEERAATLDLTRDDEVIKESVQAFSDAFNEVRGVLDELQAGELNGDSTLRTIENALLRELGSSASITGGSFTHLSQIGLSLDRNGTMQFDSSRMEEAIDTDFSGFSALFADETSGFAVRLEGLMTTYVETGGIIDSREDGLAARKDSLVGQQSSLEFRLELTERNLRAEFTLLDTTIAQLQSTSSFLSAQLGG